MSGEDDDPTAPDASRALRPPPQDGPLEIGGRPVRPGDRVGPYVFEQEIGAGAMARVLLTRTPDGQRVALKLLRADRLAAGLARFRREYHVLSRLHHPNIVAVHGYGDLDGVPYIAMEYVPGADLHQIIREMRGWPDEKRHARVRAILVDLCRALSALHRRGLVHRDLKPSNVLVTDDGVCKLTDFGIVKDADGRVDQEGSASLAGTWAYASPEHISGQAIDHRSDLYSLGVILFAMLTGKRPFVADDMAGYLEAHRSRPAPRAAKVQPGVPPVLDEICDRLLAKAPRDRFQSAREVLYRLDVDDLEEPDDGDGAWRPPWVGPRELLDTLDQALGALVEGNAGVLRVRARDGLGRTRILEELVARARGVGLPFHQHTFTAEGSTWTVLGALARDLARELDDDEDAPLHTQLLASLESGPRGEARRGLAEAVAEALVRLSGGRPRVVTFDDVHLGPAGTGEALRFLARRIASLGGEVLVAVAGRPSEELDGEAWQEGLDPVDVSLAPLTVADVCAVVGSLVGPGRTADVLGQRLHAESEGSPVFVVEFLRSLVAQGLVVRQDRGWRLTLSVDDLATGRLEIPPSIRAVFRRRVAGCAPADRELLDVLSLVGASAEPRHLATALDHDEADVLRRLERLEQSGIVARAGEGDAPAWRLGHGKLAEALRLELNPTRSAALHRALAVALEAGGGRDPDTLAAIGEHHRQGGDAARAYEHLVTAAAAFARHEMGAEALRLLGPCAGLEAQAAAMLPPARLAELRAEALRAKARALSTSSRWEDATEIWAALKADAEARGEERLGCEARVGLASVLRRVGRLAEARAEAQQGLAVARRLKLRATVADALVVLAGVAWAEGDPVATEQLCQEGLVVAQGQDLAVARSQLLLGRSVVLGLTGQTASALRSCAEAEVLMRALSMEPQRARVLAQLGDLHAVAGELAPALTRAQQALTVAQRVESPFARCAALRSLGNVQSALGQGCDAHEALVEAVAVASRIRATDEALAASVALVQLAFDRSDPATALRAGADALAWLGSPDPAMWTAVLQAQLARALGRRRPLVALNLLRAAEATLSSQPAPRRQMVRLAAAQAWSALGDRERAVARAQEIVGDPAARPFRLVVLDARALLAEWTVGEESVRHRKAGADLMRELTDNLAPDLAESLRRRPPLRALVTPPLTMPAASAGATSLPQDD